MLPSTKSTRHSDCESTSGQDTAWQIVVDLAVGEGSV